MDLTAIPYAPSSYTGVATNYFVVLHPGMSVIGLDAGMLDKVEALGDELVFTVDALDVAVHISDGAETVQRFAQQLRPYTQHEPIVSIEVYEDARRRLQSKGSPVSTPHFRLFVGDDAVTLVDDSLQIGSRVFKISEVEELAAREENLPLQHGARLQASLALLVVAAERRTGGRERFDLLAQRIADYEGRHPASRH